MSGDLSSIGDPSAEKESSAFTVFILNGDLFTLGSGEFEATARLISASGSTLDGKSIRFVLENPDLKAECQTDSDCPEGKSCQESNCLERADEPECSSAKPCPSGQKCLEGLCEDRPKEEEPAEPVLPEYECQKDEDCGDRMVCSGGRCHEKASAVTPDSDEPEPEPDPSLKPPVSPDPDESPEPEAPQADPNESSEPEAPQTDPDKPTEPEGLPDPDGPVLPEYECQKDEDCGDRMVCSGGRCHEKASLSGPQDPPAPVKRAMVDFMSAMKKDDPDQQPEPAPSGSGSGGAAAPPQVSLHPVCRRMNVRREACKRWLSVRFADKTCLDAGIMTRLACEKFLIEGNGGLFPGCLDKTEVQCQELKDLTTISYLPEESMEKAKDVVAAGKESGYVPALPEITPINQDQAGDATWRESTPAEGTETSDAVIIIDSDRDGVPDDLEIGLGTDPKNQDTDGDGVSDGEELSAGSDPLQSGAMMDGKLDPTAKALVTGQPLEQPRGSGERDDGWKVEDPAGPAVGEGEAGQPKDEGPVLNGTCAPNSTCLLYIYSYAPVVLSTIADENGNFSYRLGDSISDGQHTVYVAVTDDRGKITKKSSPLSFFIRGASAVTAADFLEDDIIITNEPIQRQQSYFMYGAIALVLFGLLVVTVVIPRVRQEKVIE